MISALGCRQFREPGVFADPVFAHNDYLHLLAEFGIVGVAALVPFLVMHARSGWLFLAAVASRRTSRWTDEGPGSLRDQSPALIVGALSSLAAFVLHSFVDFNLHIPPNALLLAFIFGLLANPYHDLKPKAPQPARRFAPLFIPAFGLWLACAALPRWPAESLAEKARVLLSDWQYREFPDVSAAAAACARQAIERDPRHPDLYGYLGDSSLALAEMIEEPMRHARHFDEALAAYRQGIEVCPRDVNLLLGLVNVLDTLKRFDEAEPLIQRAIELDPSSRDVRWALASHLEKCDRLDEAEKEFNRAIELGIGGAGYTALQQIKAKRDAARLKNATPPQAAH